MKTTEKRVERLEKIALTSTRAKKSCLVAMGLLVDADEDDALAEFHEARSERARKKSEAMGARAE